MSSKIFAIVCAFAVFNAVTAQVLTRSLPFGNVLPLGVDLFPNQVFVNSPVLPVAPSLVNLELPGCVETVLSAPVTVPATTTIIQDSTVANNLANALQLLIVSNLLSNTLPCMGADVVVPYAAPVDVVSPLALAGLSGCGCGGLSTLAGLPTVAGLPAGYSYVF